jgi:hypothetical protein
MITWQRIVARSVLTIALTSAPFVGRASGQASAGNDDTLQAVLDRIHQHAANDAWQQAGWNGEQIERWLEKLIGTVAKAADIPELKLPVRFGDVKPADATAGRTFDKALLVGKNIHLRSAQLRNSIVLADGNVEADSLEGCVVVARGAISAARSSRCVLLAGAYVKVGTDGQPSKADNRSLIITRGWANIQSLHGSIIAAPEGVTIGGIPDGGIFINATLVMSSSILSAEINRSRSVKVRDLPLEDLPVHPLARRLAMIGVIYPERSSLRVAAWR